MLLGEWVSDYGTPCVPNPTYKSNPSRERIYHSGRIKVVWKRRPKISEAMDGRREAHREVLVAVFGRRFQTAAPAEKSGYKCYWWYSGLSSTTASINAFACSGSTSGVMPCPRLKI